MTKKFGPWIKFNGKTCPVNSDDIVRVQLGGTLNLGEQPAHKLNWDRGVITAYRILGGAGKAKTQEDKFIQLMMDDTFKKDPFKSKGINIDTLNYVQIVTINPTIFKEFILYSYVRLEELPSLDDDYILTKLMEIKKWLELEKIWKNLVDAYKTNNIPMVLDELPFSEKSSQYLVNYLLEVIDNKNKKLVEYVNSLEQVYKEFFALKK